jgi:hypothetical protein
MQQLARYGDNDIDEERAIEKFLRVIPKKYSQVAIAIEMLLDFFQLSIEEVTSRLKAINNHEQLPPSESVTIDGKLLFTEEQWFAASWSGRRGRPRVLWLRLHRATASVGRASGTRRMVALLVAPTMSARLPAMTPGTTIGGPTARPRTIGRRSATVRHTSRKRRG